MRPGPARTRRGGRPDRGDPARRVGLDREPSATASGSVRPRTGSGPGPAPAARRAIRARATARRPVLLGGLPEQLRPSPPTESSGKSSNDVTQRGFAAHGRMHRSPKNATVRPPGPVPRTTTAWWPAEWPPVGTTDTPGQHLPLARRPSPRRPSRGRAAAPAGRTRRRAASSTPSAISHSARWATIGARGNARDPSASSSPPAWSKWRWLIATTSTVPGSNPAARERRHDRRRPRTRASRRSLSSPARRCPSRRARDPPASRSAGS